MIEKNYQLRNHPALSFQIREHNPTEQYSFSFEVTDQTDQSSFVLEISFEQAFTDSKPNFDRTMYQQTALELVKSTIESYRHYSQKLVVKRNSGLVESSQLETH